MAKDIVTKAEILGGEIDVRANFGQTVKVTVSPDPYVGDTEVTPSDQTQVLQTKKKFVQDDITIFPAPTETLATSENGTFLPSSGNVGFSEVTVDVEPALESLSVTENGLYLPESGTDGYDRVSVDVPGPDLRPLSASENGSYQPDGFDGYDRVNVNVLSIMDNLLEIVSSVTPDENTTSMEFPLSDIKTGMYIIVSDPPGTREFASQQIVAETFNMVEFDIRGVTGGSLQCAGKTICYRKTSTSAQETDWWTPRFTLGENSITVDPTSGRHSFLAGVTYYLLRVKGA